MSSLLPLKPTPSALDDRASELRLVDLTDSDADRILPSIASTTARNILEVIYEEPRTASDVACELETSVQNVSYHLERLSDANLVEVVETWYSSKGREMDVYAPVYGPLVLYVGAERTTPSLATALRRVLGAAGIVGLASAFVHWRWASPGPTATMELAAAEPATPTRWQPLVEFGTGPGGFVLWFGLFLVACWFVHWYLRRYRPLHGPDGRSEVV